LQFPAPWAAKLRHFNGSCPETWGFQTFFILKINATDYFAQLQASAAMGGSRRGIGKGFIFLPV
jgi:hypothetical protein